MLLKMSLMSRGTLSRRLSGRRIKIGTSRRGWGRGKVRDGGGHVVVILVLLHLRLVITLRDLLHTFLCTGPPPDGRPMNSGGYGLPAVRFPAPRQRRLVDAVGEISVGIPGEALRHRPGEQLRLEPRRGVREHLG